MSLNILNFVKSQLLKAINKWNKSPFKVKCCFLLSFLIMLCVSILVGIKAYNFVPIGDDLLYRFILDNQTLWSNYITSEISDLGDAIASQYRQYFVTNGRTLVHILVQMFAGPWGTTAFSIFMGSIFGISMRLLVVYTIPQGKRYNPVIWLLITVCFLYIFQGHGILWSRLAGGTNYLYPIALTLAFLIVYKSLTHFERLNNNRWIYPLLGLLGFLTGWSHECFCIPLSATMFIRFCTIIYEHKTKTVSPAKWIMIISLWIGSAILVFAPGNFIRVAESPNFVNTLGKGIGFLLNTKTFCIVVILMTLLAIFNKILLRRLIKDRRYDFIMLFFSILFGMIANTGSWSFIGVSFFSMIVLLGGVGLLKISYNYISITIGLLGFIPICIHQTKIIESMYYLKDVNERFIEFYKQSPDEIFMTPAVEVPANVKNYVYNWYKINNTDEILNTLNVCYFNRKNNAIMLNDQDYNAYMGNIKKEGSGTSNESVLSSIGERYLWFQKNNIHNGDTLVLTYPPFGQWSGPIGWLRKLKRGSSVILPDKEYIIISDSTVLVGKGDFLGVKKSSREIIDITINAYSNEENLDTCTNVQ